MLKRELTRTQRVALLYVDRHQTPDYGVIIRYGTGVALIARGLAVDAKRRRISEGRDGICVRLTDKGKVELHGEAP